MSDFEKKISSAGKKVKQALGKASDKLNKTIDSIRENENVEEMRKFAIKHKRDTVVYVLLLIGLVVSFFRPFMGDAIIGIVVGIYFADELVTGSRKLNDFIEKQGLFRIVIFCFTGIALFLAAPGIFLGAAIAIGLKLLVAPKSGTD